MQNQTTAAVTVDAYSTTAVETNPDGWTAKISKTEVSATGQPETVTGLVEVGSISQLLHAFGAHKG
jgi:hypothetical protein